MASELGVFVTTRKLGHTIWFSIFPMHVENLFEIQRNKKLYFSLQKKKQDIEI